MCVSCGAESDPEGVFSFAAVYRGYRACRRRKRGTANAQRYERRLLDHLVDTSQALRDRTYAPSRSLCFVARQPKAREIHAADFRDRVVHHVLVPRLEALFEPVFIHDLYSNRTGKGTHAAVDGVGWGEGRTPTFTGGVMLGFTLVHPNLHRLKTETVYRCGPEDLRRVPEHKRLSAAPPGKGLPIGNLTSQFFANVKLAGFERQLVRGGSLRLPCEPREQLRAVLASYLGHFSHADASRLTASLFVRHPWLGWIFSLRGGRLVPRWEPAGVTSLRSQVEYFRRLIRGGRRTVGWGEGRAPASTGGAMLGFTLVHPNLRHPDRRVVPVPILIQLGNRVAVFGPDLTVALAAAPWLARWRSARVERRAGLGPGLSWPVSHVKGIGRSLRQAGVPYAFVAEEGYLRGGMKRRVLRYLFTNDVGMSRGGRTECASEPL